MPARRRYDHLVPIEKLSDAAVTRPFKLAVSGVDDGQPMPSEHHDPRDSQMAAELQAQFPVDDGRLRQVFDRDAHLLGACGLQYPLVGVASVVGAHATEGFGASAQPRAAPASASTNTWVL